MERLLKKLKEANVGKVLENEPLKNHTTMKIGGPADIFIEPVGIDGVINTIKIVNEEGALMTTIGRGSNILVPDEGIRGVVMKIGEGLDHLEVEGTKVRVGGGYSLVSLATTISKKGLSGLEFAGGIPGSVGGAVYMNAGAHGSDISKILEKALVVFRDGSCEWLSNTDMKYSYRTSVLQKERPGVVVEAVFQLRAGDRETIVKEMQKNKDYRRETQPWNYPCAGSIFRNPLPNYAGQLIEKAGLKGYKIGGAKVSELHGNFIVNTGNATANDVIQLIKYIQDVIFEKFSIRLETEVEFIGKLKQN
ncbi:UDP-N-acetylmuramate dehydrogenase [Calidifontibacillus erzurumensis]|uniref:UDP-N-acetylenolpyruvoylglucosamine reductase n=1 Tax=Calidifontibacillus erzurumensis TaxID=2741433 RepID=A0A8J8KAN2_9BACI|nr:UDP-N-acetylmuramate dehydrogenase [Calidifontibacillus erzurumensis]NSL50782.1 UDP-N-acetylmuramate dehydrogenase [Calidifontibacillus erzurumensis]